MPNKNEQLSTDLTAAKTTIVSLQTNLTAQTAKVGTLTAALANADAQNTALAGQVTTLTSQLAAAQADAISDANLSLAAQLANGEFQIAQ